MKKTILKSLLYALLAFFTLEIQAQLPYISSFPDSSARWINARVDYNVNSYNISSTTNYCLTNTDTVINEMNYTKLDTCEGGYKGALRNDSGKVYFVPKDSISEYLTYDFTVQDGDTIEDVYFESYFENQPSFGDVVVSYSENNEIAITLINYDEPHGAKGWWLKNIGAISGLFRPPWVWVAEGGAYVLECFSHNDTIYSLEDVQPGTCALDLSVGYLDESEVEIYPNPGSDKVVCEFGPGQLPKEIVLLDGTGKKVEMQFERIDGHVEFDLTSLPAGIYFLKFTLNDRSFTRKIMKQG